MDSMTEMGRSVAMRILRMPAGLFGRSRMNFKSQPGRPRDFDTPDGWQVFQRLVETLAAGFLKGVNQGFPVLQPCCTLSILIVKLASCPDCVLVPWAEH